MRVMGIDPGLRTIGIGIVERGRSGQLRAVDWMIIETTAELPLADRLRDISTDLRHVLREQQPDLAVVEQLFFAANATNALAVAHARGVILAALAQERLPTLEPTPLQLKAAVTGDGRADKRQVQDMLQRILRIRERPQPDDAADALALAVYGCLHGARDRAMSP